MFNKISVLYLAYIMPILKTMKDQKLIFLKKIFVILFQ